MDNQPKPPAKVSEFAGRREKRDGIPHAIRQQPNDPGGDQGTFERPKCGACIHWKKSPTQGVGFGHCMMMPPTAFPVPGPDGVPVGVMNVRPAMKADQEGCDQFEDENGNGVFEDDDGDDDEGQPVKPAIAAAG